MLELLYEIVLFQAIKIFELLKKLYDVQIDLIKSINFIIG